jgi:FKBP-type peptidyl-prolyl cis-trans isomerase
VNTLACVVVLGSAVSCGTPKPAATAEAAPVAVVIGPTANGGAPQVAPPSDEDKRERYCDVRTKTEPNAVPTDLRTPPPNAVTTATGLQYCVLVAGDHRQTPLESNELKAHYSGWTTDGKMFDSSVKRGEAFTFRVGQVIKGWAEMVKLMSPGESVRVWIPGELAYGNTPRTGRPSGTLVFEIELLSIQ